MIIYTIKSISFVPGFVETAQKCLILLKLKVSNVVIYFSTDIVWRSGCNKDYCKVYVCNFLNNKIKYA